MRRGAFPFACTWLERDVAHTRAMRQWACVFALLLGLAGNGYAAAARIRIPIPIERRLDSWASDRRLIRTLGSWRA
jgi:hypothetical protein